jgi:hypothetical protein
MPRSASFFARMATHKSFVYDAKKVYAYQFVCFCECARVQV